MNKQPILAVRSYANPYDRAYDLFKNTQNFKNDMWNTSVRNGDINLYLTLLDNTKAIKFRDEFYNPQYYDYDTMMLDMAKENYDNTEASLSQRETISYDESGKEIKTKTEQEYTDKQWAEIQLNQLYDIRRKEIEREVEQARKDNMSWLEKTGHTILGTLGELGEGVLTGVTGLLDYVAGNFYAMYKGVAEGQNFADAFTEYFGKGLTALEKDTLRKSLDEYEAKYSYIRNVDGSYTDVGKYLGSMANSIGMMIPSIAMNFVAPGSGSVLFYTSMYGNRMYELETDKLTKGSPSLLKITNGFVSSAAEATIEWGLGKILGGTVGNKLLGINGNFNIGDIKRLGAKVLFKSAAQEGLEEVIQDFSTGLVNTFSSAIYAGYGNKGIGGEEGVTFQTLVDSFIMGFGTSLILSGVTSATNSIKTSAEGRVEAKIQKGLADGSLIENADGTIVDKNGNKVANSKYITPRIEVDGKLEKVSGLTRFVYNDLIQGFQEAISKLQEGKGNIKLAREVFTAFNQLASLYKSFGDERLAKAQSLLNMYEQNKDAKYVNNKAFSSYMISEFNDMVNNAPERVNKKLAEEGAKLLEKANKQLEENETKNITAVATKSDTIIKNKKIKSVENLINRNAKKAQSDINQNKLNEFTKDYDWVFVTDGKEAFEGDKNTIFVPESWLANYKKTEIYEFIQQNEIIKNIKSYPSFTSLLEFIDKTFTDLTGTKITNKNKDEALVNFLFNEKFYQYVLFSKIDNKTKLGKYATTEFKDTIFKLHTIVDALADKAKNDVNKSLIKKLHKQMTDAQRKPTIKAIVHWNIDPQVVGADNILTKEDRELIQRAQVIKKQNVNNITSKQISQQFIRRHKNSIDKINNGKSTDFTKEEAEIIKKGLKDNASINDRLITILLLELQKEFNNENTFLTDSIIMPIEAFNGIDDYKANVEHKANILNDFKQLYGKSAVSLYNGDISDVNYVKLSNDMEEMGLELILDEESRIPVLKDFVVKKLESLLGNNFIVVQGNTSFTIVSAMPVDEILNDKILNPKDGNKNKAFISMFRKRGLGYEALKLSEIVEIDGVDLSNYKVKLVKSNNKLLFGANANFSGDTIYIAFDDNDNINSIVNVFAHEFNHLIQKIFNLPGGTNTLITENMPDLLDYIKNNYSPLVNYIKRNDNDFSETRILSYIAYKLAQGELFANYHRENGRLVHGFVEIDNVLISPDGKHKFNVPKWSDIKKLKNKRSELSKLVKENMTINRMETSFNNMQLITDDLSVGTRDTYHSALTNKSVYELVTDLTREDISILDKISLNLDNIIKRPQKYLKQEILTDLRNSGRSVNSEGDVYYFLKSYLEKKYGNISIDRNSINNTYVFVNDSAFNDLIKESIGKNINDNNDLVEELKSTKFKLSDIYNKSELSKLKVPDDIEVVTGENYDNEFVVDKEHPAGIIYINTKYNNSNISFIRAINHEFRHLLQYYYNFEQGFTVDFLLTKEQLNDIKEHVPEIFTDEENIRDAKEMLGDKASKADIENLIGRMFIYYMTGGEQNAYGIKANFLMNKPCYVRYDGGNPTIFMPWYDGKNGKYETKFIANRAMNKKTSKSTKQLTEKKTVTSFDRTTGKYLDTTLSLANYKNKPKEKSSRYFSNTKAKGTLLENFIVPHKQNQMDPNLQNFLIQGTPLYDIMPNELKYSIDKGILTAQKLYHWFRTTKKIKPEIFELINDTMFKNKYFKSAEELEKFTNVDIEKSFTTIVVLMKDNIDVEEFFKEQGADNIIRLFDKLYKDNYWKPLIKKEIYKFRRYYDNGVTKYFEITEDALNYMKVFAMRYFDGTLSSLFLMGRTLRKVMREISQKETVKKLSLDAKVAGRKGEGGASLIDMIDQGSTDYVAYNDTDDVIKGFNLSDNTDIYKLFAESNEIVQDAQEHIEEELGRTDKELLLTENQVLKFRQQGATSAQLATIAQKAMAKLSTLSDERINEMYEQLKVKEMTLIDTTETITNKTEDNNKMIYREQIVRRIKNRANYIKEHTMPYDWKNLPKEIQDMFDNKHNLKKEVYSVGYANKTTGPAPLDKITKNLEILINEAANIKNTIELVKKGKQAIKRIEKNVKKRLKKELVINTNKSTKLKDKNYETEIRVKTEKGRTEFNIYSSAPMPDIVKDIFDTSFNSMAETRVQFASRDEDGRLYTKDSEEFKSAQKHEVSNWDAFYKANYETLNQLTRSQVIEIVEFIIKGNPISLDESLAKLEAFKIFLLGYILDGARNNVWEMAQSDITQIEKYYESLASTAGSTLNAVNQMIKVVNPLKQIRQLMLDKYNVSPENIDNLNDDLNKLQTAKTEEAKKVAYEKISKTVKTIEKEMATNAKPNSVWEQIKSFRFMSMLSGPLTWLRNFVSNNIVTKFNKASDALASFVFRKKDFRKGQWNLASTETSNEVVKFINENIKNSPLLDDMYDASTKYDTRAKVSKKQKELFITLVTNSIESKYAAEHRFSKDALNKVSNFVSKMISDKKFIKGAALKYLGKILTIENKAGRIKLDEGLSTDVLNLFAEAVILASQDYMHKRSFFADMLDALRSSDNTANKIAYEVITTWQPFLNSGWNWFTALLDYTPIGIGKGIYQMLKLEKSINKMDEKRAKGHLTPDSRVAEYLARRSIGSGILGTILTAVGFLLTSCGIVKIEDDDDEFRLKIGDITIDISDVFGTSTLLCGMALGQLGSKSFVDILKTMTTETTNGFILIDILDRYQYSYQTDGSLGILLLETENFLKSFIPNIYQQFVRASKNQKVKYGKGFLGLLSRTANAFVPFVSIGEKVVNIYTGEPQAKYAIPFLGEYLKGGALFGVKLFTDVITEEERFAQSYGLNKGPLTGKLTIDGKEYSIKDDYSLNIKYGELNKKALAQLPNSNTIYKVQMPDGSYKNLKFNQMSDEQKKNTINKVMTANAKIAKIYQWTNEGHKYYASNEEFNSLKKLGITTNVYRGDKGFVE